MIAEVEVEQVVVQLEVGVAHWRYIAVDKFAQLPSLLGRQFTHDFAAFTQAQLLHKPALLHLQHTISINASSSRGIIAK